MRQPRSLRKLERLKICEQLYRSERQVNPMLRIVIEVSDILLEEIRKAVMFCPVHDVR